MRRRSDALKALRSALVSRIYQSGFVGGMTVRVIRFESLSSVESVELNIWQPVKTDTSPRADPNEATGGVEHDTDGTDAAAVPQVPCTKDVQVSDAAGGEINTEQEAREGREAGSDEQAAGSAEAGASEGSASADEGVAKAKEVTYERMTMEAKSFALVQLSWTAETKMESFREAGKAMDFPHAGASAKEICKWIKNRETLSARGDAVRNPLYGSLVVNASPIANDNLFLVVSMAVNLQDGLKLTDEEFKDNLRQDVATAQAAATGMDVSQIAVLVVKMDPRRNYAVLELKDKKEQKKLQRTSSFQRTSSLENKMQRHETLTLLHKLQQASVRASSCLIRPLSPTCTASATCSMPRYTPPCAQCASTVVSTFHGLIFVGAASPLPTLPIIWASSDVCKKSKNARCHCRQVSCCLWSSRQWASAAAGYLDQTPRNWYVWRLVRDA